jgi:hypothetical protein
MVNVIVAKKKHDASEFLGKFVDDSHYDTLITADTDCYKEVGSLIEGEIKNNKDERKIAFKFRKDFFNKKEQEQAYLGLKEAAQPSQNRGLAAGPRGEKLGGRDWATVEQLDILNYLSKLNGSSILNDLEQDLKTIKAKAKTKTENRGLVWLTSEVQKHNFTFEKWLKSIVKKSPIEAKKEAIWVLETFISDTTYANSVNSGIAGWFDRYPRIPYGRATSYTQQHFDKFKMAFPFLQSLNRGFKELLPWRYGNQKAAADKIDSKFLVPDTVFTTITVNKNFRTAAHFDAGDFSDGLSNLLVLSNGKKFSGGYLVFPEYGVAVDVRPGDLLLVNNHEILHGNTPIVLDDPEAERISLVCYFREKMLELGSYEYENLRYQFVESRRLNKEHPGHDGRHLWNGISEGMWESEEWYNYLKSNGGHEMYEKYHKDEQQSTLEALFG